MLIYFRDRANNGALGVIDADCGNDHAEGILMVQESLVQSGEGFDSPVLALIHGGKQ